MDRRRLFLVRHGETEGESSIRYHGVNDVALSTLGRRQIAGLVPHVADERFSAIAHSPLRRAAVSAELLLEGLRIRPPIVEPDPDLREIDFGRFEGWTDEEIRAADPRWHASWKAGDVTGYPDGDDIDAFRARAAAAVRRFVARHAAGDLLVVAHKGVLNAAMMDLCDLAPEAIRNQHMDLASLWVLREGDPWMVERQNVTAGVGTDGDDVS